MGQRVFLLTTTTMALLLASGVVLAITKVGGPGDDTLRGTADRDLVKGRGGNDTLHGLAGNDTTGDGGLYGGPGGNKMVSYSHSMLTSPSMPRNIFFGAARAGLVVAPDPEDPERRILAANRATWEVN